MNNLKKIREMYKISQTELGKTLNTTQRQVSLYETGTRELRENQIIILCKAYNADFLLGLKDK